MLQLKMVLNIVKSAVVLCAHHNNALDDGRKEMSQLYGNQLNFSYRCAREEHFPFTQDNSSAYYVARPKRRPKILPLLRIVKLATVKTMVSIAVSIPSALKHKFLIDDSV